MPPNHPNHGSRPEVHAASGATLRDVRVLLLLTVAVGAIVIAAHWPALSAAAISMDDPQYLTENQLVQNPSWASARRFLTEALDPSTVGGYYQPLTMISLMLDVAMGGSPENLRPFHRTSLLLHAANTALVIVLLYLLFGEPWPAALAGLLFGVHPLTVESIPWVGERKTLLATFFVLTCMVVYVRYAARGWRGRYLACVVLYFLALMSKPTSTPLPVLLLLLDYWPLGRLWGEVDALSSPVARRWLSRARGWLPSTRVLLEKVPFLALAALFAVVTVISQGQTVAVSSVRDYPFLLTPAIYCYTTLFYLYRMVWPTDLSLIYPWPEPLTWANPWLAGSVAATVILAGVLLISWRWTRVLVTGAAVFLVGLAPTLMTSRYSWGVGADKYVYLPLLGMLMILAWLFARWLGAGWRQSPRAGLSVLLILAVVGVAVAEVRLTRRQLSYWQTSLSLRQRMAERAPNHADSRLRLAEEYARAGMLEQSSAEYAAAHRLKPDWVLALNNEAWVRATHPDARFRDGTEAIRLAQQACKMAGTPGPALLDTLAAACAEAGEFDDAARFARTALDQVSQLTTKGESPEVAALEKEIRPRLDLYESRRPYRDLSYAKPG